MGAGAGVKITCREFSAAKMTGKNSVRISMVEATMSAYDWSMMCNRPGYLVVDDAIRVLSAMDWVEYVMDGNHMVPTEDIVNVDLSKAELSPICESDFEFIIGGGYCVSHLRHGSKIDLRSPYGYSLGLEIAAPGRLRNGHRCIAYGVWYPESFVFMPSDMFADMHEWCWENKDCEFVPDMCDIDALTERERESFISAYAWECWNLIEQQFNEDDYYDKNGNIVSSNRKKGPKRSTKWSFSRCTDCKGLNTETEVVRKRSDDMLWVDERRTVVCRDCGSRGRTSVSKKLLFNTKGVGI